MPVLRFAARRASGGWIAQQSSSGSCARQIRCRWGRKLASRWKRRRDTGTNLQASSDAAPRSPLPGTTLRAKYVMTQAFPALTPLALTANGPSRKTLPVRRLPHGCADLQPLRSRPPLLHHDLRRRSPPSRPACGRQPLSSQPARPSRACPAAAPLPGQSAESDASGFPTCGPACSTDA